MIDPEKRKIIYDQYGPPMIFALTATRKFGERVVNSDGVELASIKDKPFNDGEPLIKSEENIRGRKVFLIQSIHQITGRENLHKRFNELLILAESMDKAAYRVAVIPYLMGSRQDRKTEPRDPWTSRWVAKMIQASGLNHLIFMELHNEAILNAYHTVSSEVLNATDCLVDYLIPKIKEYNEIAIIAPDTGALSTRVNPIKKKLEIKYPGLKVIKGYVDKERIRDVGIKSQALNCNESLDKKLVLIPDDEAGSTRTILNTAHKVREDGAGYVIAFVTHNKLEKGVKEIIEKDPSIDEFVTTDTILRPKSYFTGKLHEISVASLFYKAIEAVHYNESVSEFL
ncbi:MAG: ribose-phosphate diphosphokinase [Candidatus Nanoarchaeia archaeon]|nr:ribose-phosphate diphosphokinase [Candidatus Nanoarchaeia archaeon]